MQIVNIGSTPINLFIASRYITVNPGAESINTLLSDRDIMMIVESFTPEQVKFRVTAPATERNQLADCQINPSYIFDPEVDTKIVEETRQV